MATDSQLVQADLSWSAHAMIRDVWPLMAPALGGGYLLPLEGRSDPVRRLLDLECGIDYIQVHPTGWMRAIASRVQVAGATLYNTFTVRSSRSSGACTELEKRRLAAGVRGAIMPEVTIQAYLETKSGPPLTAAACWTRDLLEMIGHLAGVERTASDGASEATFIAISWEQMRQLGYPVAVGDWTHLPEGATGPAGPPSLDRREP
jgi:hypothetical protein